MENELTQKFEKIMEFSALLESETVAPPPPKYQFTRIDSNGFDLWFCLRRNKIGQAVHARSISVRWMKAYWSKNGTGQIWRFRTNGARKSNGDRCLDVSLTLGYLNIAYVNWDLQGEGLCGRIINWYKDWNVRRIAR